MFIFVGIDVLTVIIAVGPRAGLGEGVVHAHRCGYISRVLVIADPRAPSRRPAAAAGPKFPSAAAFPGPSAAAGGGPAPLGVLYKSPYSQHKPG